MSKISVFILTFNEAANIRRCLCSVKNLTDDIVIVDSFSTDATLDICREFGCRIVQNKFVNHAVQCNWAMETVEFKNDWLLRLDSDEFLPEAIKAEIDGLVSTLPDDVSGVYLNRRQYFMNRWLKHGGIYPHHILRLFRKGSGSYENKTEEHFVLKRGRAVRARHDFLEDNRNNDLDFWLDKHRSLASGEVRDTLGVTSKPGEDIEPSLFGEKVQRTRWFKLNIYQRSPLFLRSFLYFFYRYILRLGFLDGMPGFIYFVNQSFWYRFFVDSRIYEMRSGWKDVQNDYRNI
jgi:glycosyltransferase involved in cell wall biosynthesis